MSILTVFLRALGKLTHDRHEFFDRVAIVAIITFTIASSSGNSSSSNIGSRTIIAALFYRYRLAEVYIRFGWSSCFYTERKGESVCVFVRREGRHKDLRGKDLQSQTV